MYGIAILAYLLAICIPVYLLRHFHAKAWYWHVLATMGALGLGTVPTPPEWKTAGMDLGFGFVFVLLLIWGLGGLLSSRPPRERHP